MDCVGVDVTSDYLSAAQFDRRDSQNPGSGPNVEELFAFQAHLFENF
jgi:hypothetical protein